MFKFNGMSERKLLNRNSAPLSFDQLAARNANLQNKRDSAPPNSYDPRSSSVKAAPVSPNTEQSSQAMPEWYLGHLTRDAAIEILNRQPIGTFLVRDSETSKTRGSYTLSLRHRDKCRHHKIETIPTTGQLCIKGYERHPFPNLQVLVKFFIQTQEKDIRLIPYNPSDDDRRISQDMSRMSIQREPHQGSSAGAMNGRPTSSGKDYISISQDMSHMSIQHEPYQESSAGAMNGNPTSSGSHPPPLPSRKPGPLPSYENVKEKGGVSPTPPRRAGGPQSYENIPSKDKVKAAPGPPLPTRASRGPHSYENVASKIPQPPPPGSYENMPERNRVQQSYQNVAPRGGEVPVPQAYQNRRPAPHPAGPTHSYQNLPPKVAPRRVQTFNSGNKPTIPQRTKPAPVRRSRTASEQEWNEKGF